MRVDFFKWTLKPIKITVWTIANEPITDTDIEIFTPLKVRTSSYCESFGIKKILCCGFISKYFELSKNSIKICFV